MGRGRAKAKQTKVARDLKYNTGNTDLNALQAELSNSAAVEDDGAEFEDDPYAKYYNEDSDEDTEDSDS